MNVNPDVVSSALPICLEDSAASAKNHHQQHKQQQQQERLYGSCDTTITKPSVPEVPIIITSCVPDREKSLPSLGGGNEDLPVSHHYPGDLHHQQFFYPTPTTTTHHRNFPHSHPYEICSPRVVHHNPSYRGARPQSEGPMSDSMSHFVANDLAEACLTLRPPAQEEPSNEKYVYV